jgi:hypothetical protein
VEPGDEVPAREQQDGDGVPVITGAATLVEPQLWGREADYHSDVGRFSGPGGRILSDDDAGRS